MNVSFEEIATRFLGQGLVRDEPRNQDWYQLAPPLRQPCARAEWFQSGNQIVGYPSRDSTSLPFFVTDSVVELPRWISDSKIALDPHLTRT